MKRFLAGAFIILTFLVAGACSKRVFTRTTSAHSFEEGGYLPQKSFGANPSYPSYSYQTKPTMKVPNAIVVCRTYECAPADRFMSREFLYNSMIQLLDNNMGAKVQICEGDDKYQRCYDNHIRFPIRAGAADGFGVIQTARLYDIKLDRSNHKADIVIGFDMYYNGMPIECTPSTMSLFSRSTEYMVLEDSGWRCKFTTMGTSMLSIVLSIDFLDLDYGIVGGFYSIGLSGSARGGSNGYMLIKFQNNSYPENPRFISPHDLGGNARKAMMPTIDLQKAYGTSQIPASPEEALAPKVQTFSIMDYNSSQRSAPPVRNQPQTQLESQPDLPVLEVPEAEAPKSLEPSASSAEKENLEEELPPK